MANIGPWDTTNLIFSLAPNALKRGDNPAAFNTGTFPVYQGESAGAKITATLTNMASGYGYTTDGLISLDGVDDRILTDYTVSITNNFNYTIEAWVDLKVLSQYSLLGLRDDANNNFDVQILGTNKLRYYYEVGGVNDAAADDDAIPAIGIYHIAVRVNNGLMELFINGSEISTYASQDTLALGNKTYTNKLIIGWDGTSFHANVNFYQVSFYDDAISDERIASNHSRGVGNGGIEGSDNGDDTMSLIAGSSGPGILKRKYEDLREE